MSREKSSAGTRRANHRAPAPVAPAENEDRGRPAGPGGHGSHTRTPPGHARRPVQVLIPVGIVLLWLVILGVGGPSFGRISNVATNDRSAFLPASAESTQVQDRLGAFLGDDAVPAIIVAERTGGVTPEDLAALQALADAAPGALGADAGVSPPIPSEDGKAVQIVVAVPTDLDTTTAVQALSDEADSTLPPGLDAWVTGPAGFSADLSAAFAGIDGLLLLVTLAVVLVILVIVYRSPLLPILVLVSSMSALCGAVLVNVALAGAGIVTINGQIQGILFILVIGAATDYSLLYIARYREALRDHPSAWRATRAALRGTIEPIAASGGTVIVGLLCLMLSDLVSNAALGPVAAIGIVLAMLSSLTFLPAMLTLVGRAAFWPRRPLPGTPHPVVTGPEARGLWAGLGRRIAAAPRRVAAVVMVGLALGALGLTQLDASGVPTSELVLGPSQAREGQRTLDEHFAGGSGSPTYVLVSEDALPTAAGIVSAVDGVDDLVLASSSSPSGTVPVDGAGPPTGEGPLAAAEPTISDGDVLLEATLSSPADSTDAEQTVQRIRTELAASPETREALVGGSTATDLDTNTTAGRDLAVIVPVVLVAITLMLALLLRALVAPLVLLVCTVLSYGTALGISAVIFRLIGQGSADPTVPLYGFVFLVALGIDYSIFLMSRVREESLSLGTREGTLRGLGLTGGVITSAGVVLAATFAALAVLPIQFLLQLAIIVALGVLIDALVVRAFLVPSLAIVIGDRIWWPSRVPRDLSEQPSGTPPSSTATRATGGASRS